MAEDLLINFFTQHPYLAGLFVEISGSLVDRSSSWLGKKIFPERSQLEKSLQKVYGKTVLDFKSTHFPSDPPEEFLYKPYFFKSKILAKLLIECSLLDRKIDPIELISDLHNHRDHNTLLLTESNLQDFINLFKRNLQADPTISLLEIKEKYPFKIFGIDKKIDELVQDLNSQRQWINYRLVNLSTATSDDANFVESSDWSDERDHISLEDLYIERDIETEIHSFIQSAQGNERLALIAGDAGNGKTSLLWHLFEYYKNQTNFYPIFVKSLHLLEEDVAQLIHFADALGRDTVVFLDTIDLLLHNDADREKLLRFLYGINKIGSICVATTRPQEMNALAPNKRSLPYRIFRLGNYNEETELIRAIRRYSAIYYEHLSFKETEEIVESITGIVAGSRSLKSICLNPLTNRMLFSLYAPNELPHEINVFRLYKFYWTHRVVRDSRSGTEGKSGIKETGKDLSKAAYLIAVAMLREGVVSINRHQIETEFEHFDIPLDDIDLLAGRGVIRITKASQYVEFFHQSFFEHVCARGILFFSQKKEEDGINLFINKVEQSESQGLKEYLFYIFPVFEHLLLLNEKRPAWKDALSYLKASIENKSPERIRSAWYVYAVLEENYPELDNRLYDALNTYIPEDTIYVKRFLTAAFNLDQRRIKPVFKLLDVIWRRNIWNEQYSLIELLEYLSSKAPEDSYDFVIRNDVTAIILNRIGKARSKGHHMVLQMLGATFLNCFNIAPESCVDHLKQILAYDDSHANNRLIAAILIHPLLGKNASFVQAFIDALAEDKSKQNKHQSPDYKYVSNLSKLLNRIWALENRTIEWIVNFIITTPQSILINSALLALANRSHLMADSEADLVFDCFCKQISSNQLFPWARWIIPYLPMVPVDNSTYLEKKFYTHFCQLLDDCIYGSFQNQRSELILKSYIDCLSKIDESTPSRFFEALEPYFLNQDALIRQPRLTQLTVFSYLKNHSGARQFLDNEESIFFKNEPLVAHWIIVTLQTNSILDPRLNKLMVHLAIMHKEIVLLTSVLDQVAQSLPPFSRPGDTPLYLKEQGQKLEKFVFECFQSASDRDKIDAAHLLFVLLKLHLISPINVAQFRSLFVGKNQQDMKSWALEVLPYCYCKDVKEVNELLDLCRMDFSNRVPSLRNKARCAYLGILAFSNITVVGLQEEVLDVYFADMEHDNSDRKTKIINRLIQKYTQVNSNAAFELLISLLNSKIFRDYAERKQNETMHELHNACLKVCQVAESSQLINLANLLFTTSCNYARLILNGLSFIPQQLNLVKEVLNQVIDSEDTLPCVKEQVVNTIKYKSRHDPTSGLGISRWEEINYLLS